MKINSFSWLKMIVATIFNLQSINLQSIVFFTLSLVFSSLLHANDYEDFLIAKADEKNLSNSRGWHALLHYKKGVLNEWVSQADDDDFFLAEDGKTNPKTELEATIKAMGAVVIEANQHPQCLFPARYDWLVQELGINDRDMSRVQCKELEEWFDTIKPESLTLVFPSAYINSPSSMFGHTLLRVNPNDHRSNSPLVSYALNYAADAEATDNALVFSIKGLIGGYPGIFSIVPYYEKIKEYSDIENRDVWEYSLNFSKDEVEQLMKHVWEVRYINFDYFFLTENCSYHMLSLMEVARPDIVLTDQFSVKAIPSDTVRVVFDADLITETVYRPSNTEVLSHNAAQISDAENDLVVAITKEGKSIDDAKKIVSDDISRARIFEQAYDYSRFLSTADPTKRDSRSNTNWQLLAARSQIPIEEVWEPIKPPEVKAEDGHGTGRFAMGIGKEGDENYLSLQLRPAYHDVVDKVAGYSAGAQINFLDINLRYYEEQKKIRLKKLTFINVFSMVPIDKYFSPLSWGVDIAIERQPTRKDVTEAAQAVVDFGAGTQFFDYVTVSLFGEVNAKVAKEYEKGYSVGAGARLSLLVQEGNYSWLSNVKAIEYALGEDNTHQLFDTSVAWHLSVNHSLRLQYERRLDYERYVSDVTMSYHYYF